MSRNKKKRAGVSPRRWRVVFLSCLVMALLALVLVLPGAIGIAAGTPPSKVPGSPSGLLKASVNPEHGLGCKPTPPGDYPKAVVPQVASVAASKDLSGHLPTVGDQYSQGSCVGWAVGYYYKTFSESLEHTTWPLNQLRYQYSPSFVYNQINDGVDEGAYIPDALHLLQDKGDVDSAEFIYDPFNWTKQPTAAQFQAALPYRIPSGWGYFWNHTTGSPPYSNSITPIKACLSGGNMLVMVIPIYYDFPEYTTSSPARPYYDYDERASRAGYHAVCICGYNDSANPKGSNADHQGGFKMVNSWGGDWNGDSNGFVYLSYDFVKRYVREAWYMGDLSPDTPSVTSLSRNSGEPGDSVTISGKNFGTNRRDAVVTFNGLNWEVDATPTSWTNSSITVTVPRGAITGPLKVYDWDKAPSNPINFKVTFWLSSITPNTGSINSVASYSLEGGGFKSGAAVSSVRLWNPYVTPASIDATKVQVVSDTQITCKFNLFGTEKNTPYHLLVRKTDGHETILWNCFTVTPCGTEAGVALLALAGILGLMSTASSRRFRSRLKAMIKYRR
jgi:hypothetical protein